MDKFLLVKLLGYALIITGLYDGYKYHWQSSAIRRAKLAKGHSRKGINAAIINDTVKILYLLACLWAFGKLDVYFFISGLIAMVFMIENWIAIYIHYPYRLRGVSNFRRPGLFKYIINSFIPNKKRKRL